MDEDPFEVTGKVAEALSPKQKDGASSAEPSFFERETLTMGEESRRFVTEASCGLTMSQKVDAYIDSCIEIESNKRMLRENVSWFTLTFQLKDMESKVRL